MPWAAVMVADSPAAAEAAAVEPEPVVAAMVAAVEASRPPTS
jgi:hypothetical protein